MVKYYCLQLVNILTSYLFQDKVYDMEMNQKLNIPIVYTAMHGVGHPYVLQSWTNAGFQVGYNWIHHN